jgi:hypothetical protein
MRGWGGGNASFRTLAFFARPVNTGGSKFGKCPSDFIVILYPCFSEIPTGKNTVVPLLIFYSHCEVILGPVLLWSMKDRLYQPRAVIECIWNTDGIIINMGS